MSPICSITLIKPNILLIVVFMSPISSIILKLSFIQKDRIFHQIILLIYLLIKMIFQLIFLLFPGRQMSCQIDYRIFPLIIIQVIRFLIKLVLQHQMNFRKNC